MKVVVIGSKGMLGSDIVSLFSKKSNIDLVGFSRAELDITQKEDMELISSEQPDVVINGAAYTDVDGSEERQEECYAVNVTGVENLVETCHTLGCLLVHFSTDYVFNGEKKGYTEDDEKDPINYYGKCKSKAEDIISILEKYYIVRTSWLFGKEGKNFVSTMKTLLTEKESISVVNDQHGSPTYTKNLAKAVYQLIEKELESGIYHLTNEGNCTWFEFAQEIKKILGVTCEIKPCTTEEYPRPAKRPMYSILENRKTQKLPLWKDAVKVYLEEIK